MEPFETYEHDGITVEIHYQEYDQEHADPRQWDNLTTLVCWHPDYILGDEQFRAPNGRGAVETPFHEGGEGVTSMRHLERYLRIVRGAIGIRPLYLYDHSGISIRAGSPSPFDNPHVRVDEYGQGMGWDTTMIGFVYTTHERITELCGDGLEYHSEEWVNEQVAADVRLYDDYLRGSVYGYVVARGTDDEESCWGFLGDPDASGLREEANATAAYIAAERRANEEPPDVAEMLAGMRGER